MDKPTKPTNLMPREFGGVKNNFSANLQNTGFEDGVPTIYGGDNLNYQLDATGKELDYCEKICDFINALPIGKGITVDANNKLVYADYGTDITGKANISLNNLNSDGKERIGVKGYVATDTYSEGDVVLAIIDDKVSLFKSLIDNNTGNALTDDTKWEKVELGGNFRNIGEIVSSTLPLTDAGLHLLDGALINGSGVYSDFVDYIANIYKTKDRVYNPNAFTVVGSPTITEDGIASGFSRDNYLTITNPLIGATKYSIKVKFTLPSTISGYGFVFADNTGTTGFAIYYDSNNVMIRCASQTTVNSIGSPTANSVWEVEITYNNGTAIANYTKDGVSGTKTLNTTGYTDFQATDLFIGQRDGSDQATAYFKGSIDLKQFSITVNGVEVFSGLKPANYFTTESAWQSSISTYGVCGKFVYDSVNNTVRLPKITGIIEGTTDVTTLGDLVEAGLPNIQGSFATQTAGNSGTGAFYDNGDGTVSGASGSDNSSRTISFDASRSSSIFSNSSTVQPQTIKEFYYIVVATSTKTDIEVDIDEIATDLNGKADTDLSNVTDTGYIKMAGAGMPSGRYIDLTLGASGSTYTVPANGWFLLDKNASNQEFIYIGVQGYSGFTLSASGSQALCATLPVKKGDTVLVQYNASGTLTNFRFIYAKGAEVEAQ